MDTSQIMANDALSICIGIWLTGYSAGSSSSHFEIVSGSVLARRYLVLVTAGPTDLELVD